ncbi:ABC transporter ATP-binding protein [soil metagenome]
MADPKKKLTLVETIRKGWKPYKQLATYLKPYKKRFFLGLAFGVAAGVFNGVFPLVIKIVGDRLYGGNGTPKMGVGEMISKGGPSTDGPGIESVIWISLLIPAAMVARGVFAYLNSYCMAWVSYHVLSDLRSKLFAHLVGQSLDFFNRAKSGKLISRVLNDTRMAQNALTSIAGDIIKDPIAVITGVIVLVHMDWKFSLTTLVLFPICILPVAIFGSKVRKAGKAEENEAGTMAVILQESFAGIRVIKSFARESYQTDQFNKSSAVQCTNSMRVRKSIDIVQPLIESVSAFGVVLAIIYVYYSHINFMSFAALCAGIFLLYNPVKSLSRIPMLLQKCLSATTNVFDLMKLIPSIQDAPDATPVTNCKGGLTFEDVTFAYGEDKKAVQNISLEIEPGKQYALVGASGAGKTTMLSLILRFYDPQSGRILIDGKDIRSVKQQSLRENIGIVTQEMFLFHDTIYENIRYGRLDATRAEIEAAAKLAYAHDFIMAQPNGYDTIVGDKGSLLSGGQQQRLAIARALLKDAPILLLDEAMSALDSESESIIQAAVEQLAKGRTVIAIAHRLSTILKSDKIVVMDHGRIVESGPHAELLEKSPLYRRLYELQYHHEEAVAAGI